jgi:cytidylate kinase
MSAPQVIAMDGPAASGKSSVAREVAAKLGWIYVNTGNMYRAATWAVLEAGVSPENEDAVLEVIEGGDFQCSVESGRSVIRVGGKDVESELNSEAINRGVSHVAKIPQVREKLVAMQRAVGQAHPSVMEGRDIGTVVFPDALVKFYIDASEEVRAKRRGLQGHADTVRERDRMDSTRKIAPLVAATDALVVDSSDLTLDEVVERILELLRERGVTAAA